MEIFLVQHGEAKLEEEDPQRPLTDKGKEDVSRVAETFAKMNLKIEQILHSGKTRARQTAEIFAKYLGMAKIEEIKGIGPLDDPYLAKELIEKSDNNLMIVGHLPHLSKLVSLLIINNPEREIVKFKMGGLLGLKKTETGWFITCFFTPGL